MKLITAIKNIATNLKKMRINKKLTQEEISFKLNMERKGYQKLEYCQNKDIKLSTILKILDFYNIKLEDLLK